MSRPAPPVTGLGARVDARIKRQHLEAQRAIRTSDSFENLAARLGVGAGGDNLSTQSTYGFNPITRVQLLLEWMYRGSWIVGKAVDSIAEDMTKNGVSFLGEDAPKIGDKLHRSMTRNLVWPRILSTLKWGRLYGGAIAVVLVDGQKPQTPLRIESVGRGAFRGLWVADRWMVTPSLEDLVDDIADPEFGNPRFYTTFAAGPGLPRMKIHYSRVLRAGGIQLPYWQKVTENLWSMSVVERLYDRLLAFDSSTQGAAQLLFKAHLRMLKVKDLRTIVAAGGPSYEGLLAQLSAMRAMQTTEGLTVVDMEDEFEAFTYSFGGLDALIMQMGQQISGAIDTPLVRLFGQSPGGLNATGESEMRQYYDGIHQRQETDLRPAMWTLLQVIARSEGVTLSESFDFAFNPLWQLTDEQKAEIASKNTTTILAGVDITGPAVALKELRAQSDVTGIWTNITDDMIADAELAPAPGIEALVDPEGPHGPHFQPELPEGDSSAEKDSSRKTADSSVLRAWNGLQIVVESAKGTRREGKGWSVVMPADYGFIRGTASAEGTGSDGSLPEPMDCFVGDGAGIYVLDTSNLDTGAFDEHKVMLGFDSEGDAVRTFRAAYHDLGDRRLRGSTEMRMPELLEWLRHGNMREPLSRPPLRAVR